MASSETGSKSDLYPEQIRFEEDKTCRRRTPFEKCLVVLTFVLLMLAALFLTLFLVYYSKAEDGGKQKVCTSKDCVVAAFSLTEKMDMTTKPCDDFAQYACGAFYKNTVIPDAKNKVDSFSIVIEKNNHFLRSFLEEKIMVDDHGYVKKMKMYYRSCMDEDTIERIGVTPYKNLKEAKQWPTINPDWQDSTFDLNDLITYYERLFVEPIFVYMVSLDMKDSNKHQLHIAQPSTGLPIKYMKLARNDTTIMAYQQYYEDLAVALGADPATAKADAEALVDFEIAQAKISVTAEESIDLSTLNNPSTLKNMSLDYPYIDFHRAIQAAFDTANLTIPEDLPITNRHPKYFRKLNDLLSATDNRVIQNRFGFDFARRNVELLTKGLRKIYLKFLEVRIGKKKDDPRWRQCIDRTDSIFEFAMGKKFVTEKFAEDSKKYMQTMISKLQTSFGGLLQEAEWMEPKTKKEAFLKLNTMPRKIGYPDKNFSHEDIERRYENFTVWDGEFYRTYRNAFNEVNKRGLLNLNMPVNKDEWKMSPSEVNAYYAPMSNEIAFPAGILQPPFYSPQYPSSVNYGAIGAIIGHEITHGYDQSGSQVDYEGNLRNWWQKGDKKEFEKRTQCVIDQYSAFKVDSINMNINGKLTAGENTADMGGLKEAYRAYKTYTADQPEELPLPGLGLTTDQQFFLAFSQLWCDRRTDASMKASLLSGVHSPGMFRILGPLQNSEDFANVFQCPKGSPMNPEKKCTVW